MKNGRIQHTGDRIQKKPAAFILSPVFCLLATVVMAAPVVISIIPPDPVSIKITGVNPPAATINLPATPATVAIPGAQGPQGERGYRGYSGATGATGPQGATGFSGYSTALAAVFANRSTLLKLSTAPDGSITAPYGFSYTADDGTNAIAVKNSVIYSGPRTAGTIFHNVSSFYICPLDNVCTKL